MYTYIQNIFKQIQGVPSSGGTKVNTRNVYTFYLTFFTVIIFHAYVYLHFQIPTLRLSYKSHTL